MALYAFLCRSGVETKVCNYFPPSQVIVASMALGVKFFDRRRQLSTQIVPFLTFGDRKEEYEDFQQLFEDFDNPDATT